MNMSDFLSSIKEVSFYPGYNTVPYFCNNLILVRIIQVCMILTRFFYFLLQEEARRIKTIPLKSSQYSRISILLNLYIVK